MSWLQKRPQVSNPSLFYTVGLSKTILVVGLGNPGKEYDGTRHNIGFACVDAFTKSLEEFTGWVNKKDLKCQLNSAQLGDTRVLAVKPTTFMNNSGESVSAVVNFYKMDPKNLIVIHDELDIDFGQIRTRLGGSSAGHNGIKSVTQILGDENYCRLRIGIGPKKPARIDSKDFVLQKFSEEQVSQLSNLYKETAAILTEYIYGTGELVAETRSFIV
ncbi:MAG TPA: aminoacyl-tRNA hydrolase [Candidatus Saccharimonadales bacterium]|jgi:PTH1 family peptidyl-tRNA hydrolase